jgi:hypothetical protein
MKGLLKFEMHLPMMRECIAPLPRGQAETLAQLQPQNRRLQFAPIYLLGFVHSFSGVAMISPARKISLSQKPELSTQEKETSALLASGLKKLGYEVTVHSPRQQSEGQARRWQPGWRHARWRSRSAYDRFRRHRQHARRVEISVERHGGPHWPPRQRKRSRSCRHASRATKFPNPDYVLALHDTP